jgi:hypothetical protein
MNALFCRYGMYQQGLLVVVYGRKQQQRPIFTTDSMLVQAKLCRLNGRFARVMVLTGHGLQKVYFLRTKLNEW